MSADAPREVKVVLLGDAGVGKSSLVLRFVTGSFDKYSESTIGCVAAARRVKLSWRAPPHTRALNHRGSRSFTRPPPLLRHLPLPSSPPALRAPRSPSASFMSKAIMVDNMPIKYQIWDTAGQEKYHSLAPMYYRGVSVARVRRARAARPRCVCAHLHAYAAPTPVPPGCGRDYCL